MLCLFFYLFTPRYDVVRVTRASYVPGEERVQRGPHHAGEVEGEAPGAHQVPGRGRADPHAGGPAEPGGHHRPHSETVYGTTESKPRIFINMQLENRNVYSFV